MDARELLEGLVRTEVFTLTRRERNRVISLVGDDVIVGTNRSPDGRPVPVAAVQAALDALMADGELRVDVENLGHRSSFIGAALLRLPGVEPLSDPPRLRLMEDAGATLMSAATLERLRGRVAGHAQRLPDVNGPYVDAWVLELAIEEFNRLRVAPAQRLVTYIHRFGGNGRGVPFAVPRDVPLPPAHEVIGDGGWGKDLLEAPFQPLMEGISCDGSLRGFVQASLFRREAEEIGAAWHALDWDTHTLVDDEPGKRFRSRPRLGRSSLLRSARTGLGTANRRFAGDPPYSARARRSSCVCTPTQSSECKASMRTSTDTLHRPRNPLRSIPRSWPRPAPGTSFRA